ncbi:MAG: AI-2E family transporter [Phycisphaerales bacterium]|nr:AI-2E family transporter [Phycisphaerales bacterium]
MTIQDYVPHLSPRARRWARFFAVLVGGIVLYFLLRRLSVVVTPIAVGMAIAYILNPLVTYLEKSHRIRRAISITAIYTVGVTLFIVVTTLLVTRGLDQILRLARNAPEYFSNLMLWLDKAGFGAASQPADTTQLTNWIRERGAVVGQQSLDWLTATLSSATAWVSAGILVPMYAFFFLLHFEQIVNAVRDHLPAVYRDTIVRIASTADKAMADFFRGRLIVCMIVGVLTAIGWLIVGVPYSVPLGLLVGVLNLVPFLSILGLPPAILITYIHASQAGAPWLWPVLLAIGVFSLVQSIESFVLTPWISQHTSGLHPVTTVIVLLIGAELAGLLGMLLSIPLASTLKSLAIEWVLPEIRRLARSDSSSTSEPT